MMEKKLQPHPVAQMFPLNLESKAFAKLVKSIEERGLSTPITLHEGKILDGRHRYAACLKLGIEPAFAEWNGECGSPLLYAITRNSEAPHYSKSQRAMAAARVVPQFEKEAAERMKKGKADPSALMREGSKSSDQAARLFNVSGRYVENALTIIRCDNKDLIAAIDAGTVTLTLALQALERIPDEVSEILAEGGASELRKRTKEAGLSWEEPPDDVPLASQFDVMDAAHEIRERFDKIYRASSTDDRQLLCNVIAAHIDSYLEEARQ